MSNEIRGKVSATYADEASAKKGATAVLDNAALQPDEVRIIGPHDTQFDQKLENKDKKVGFFMLKAHMAFGLIGIVLGVFFAILLAFYGPSYTQNSPIMTVIALSILGFFVGLMLAGFISLRPDQDGVVNQSREATHDGKWVVVVNSPSHEKTEQVYDILGKTALSVSSSL
ncbi:hypothetical protein [Paraglaciecola chathamensis]|uniref:Uncharacterized protein n=1 Tax=Paraglaciecola chathamensis TaxID=368405 RepID=A0A8H9LWE5_9ALTE|nr:hypothetical protein [Paraglaciecola oceanifecundans]GGZ62461.1 hypothetical protein GCM10011274_20540 [Paraglaciecola oceanifecundans]